MAKVTSAGLPFDAEVLRGDVVERRVEVDQRHVLALGCCRRVVPSMVIVPSGRPAENVIVLSPLASVGRARCEHWIVWLIFRLSSPVPLPLSDEPQPVVVAPQDELLQVDLLRAGLLDGGDFLPVQPVVVGQEHAELAAGADDRVEGQLRRPGRRSCRACGFPARRAARRP